MSRIKEAMLPLALTASIAGPQVAFATEEQYPKPLTEQECVDRAARFSQDSQNKLTASIIGRRTLRVSADPQSMHDVFPQCDSYGINTDTDVVVRQSGRKIGEDEDFMSPRTDDGRELASRIRTTKPFIIGRTVSVSFKTHAKSENAHANGIQKISFTVGKKS